MDDGAVVEAALAAQPEAEGRIGELRSRVNPTVARSFVWAPSNSVDDASGRMPSFSSASVPLV